MESQVAIYKLIILYLLDRAAGDKTPRWSSQVREDAGAAGSETDRTRDGEIAMSQVTNFLIENAYINFEGLVNTFEEIKQNGFVEGRQDGDVMYLRITPEGRETVHMFRDELSLEIRSKVEAYLKEHDRKIREARSIVGEYYKAAYGGSTAHLVLRDDHRELFSVDLNLPDEDSARAVARKFRTHSDDVYAAIIEQLM